MLDKLCAVGRVVWWRPSEGGEARKTGPIRGTPIVLCERDALPHWQEAGGATNEAPPTSTRSASWNPTPTPMAAR